jgi:uncharacterized metal-binding protein
MVLVLFLFAAGVIIGTWLRFSYLAIVVFAYILSAVVMSVLWSTPIGILELVLDVFALQAGYLAGLLAITALRERRRVGR